MCIAETGYFAENERPISIFIMSGLFLFLIVLCGSAHYGYFGTFMSLVQVQPAKAVGSAGRVKR